MPGCNSCKFGRNKASRGRGTIMSVFSHCGHPKNLKKIKFDPVTGKDVYEVKNAKAHLTWNVEGKCPGYEKNVPPQLFKKRGSYEKR